MLITPTYITIGRMFEQNFLFEIPKYQRYYAWEEEQVNDYIQDINNILSNNTKEHFFGGIVCVTKLVEGSTRQQKELIDGQQRITTSILLINSIIKMYKNLLDLSDLNDEDSDVVKNRLAKLSEKYIIYNDEVNRKPQKVHKLVLSLADEQFFKNIIEDKSPKPSRDSHKRIDKAYQLLKKFVSDKLDECSGNSVKIDMLAEIESILHSKCNVIFMDCDSRASAYKLFQVLNDRGAGLNEGDLLKSKTLEALENFPDEQEQAQTYWDEILEEEPSKVESFLRTYYASCYGKRAGRTTLYDDFLKYFFSDLSDGDMAIDQTKANALLHQIKDILNEVRIYRKITCGSWPYEEAQPITGWDRNRLNVLVKFLSYDITLPILLAATKLNHGEYSKLVHNLEKFMFRYKTICGNSHQVLSEIYNVEAKKIREDPARYSFKELYSKLDQLISEKAIDEIFEVQLKNLKYQPSGGNKILRYFFSTLCDYYPWHQNGEHGKPVANKDIIINYDNVTIEHIDSQNAGNEYVLPKDSTHKLYNLTILSQDDNNHVGNKTFLEKKDVYQKSFYQINQTLLKYNDWSVANAESWQQFIVELACKVFVI